MQAETLSKGDFARALGVSPGRVSQMISEGKIGRDALEGEGKYARIRVALATRQIAERTDIGQRFGNGLTTRLDFGDEPRSPDPAPRSPAAEAKDDPIRAQKLRQLELANQKGEEEARERRGLYVRADQVTMAQGRLARTLVSVFEGAQADVAQAIAAKFNLPARDVIHLLREQFRETRVRAAAQLRAEAADMTLLIPDDLAEAAEPAE